MRAQAKKEDGWSTDPFTLFEDDTHRLIGRGSTDDKGPVMGWLNVLEAHKTLGLDLPVNLRFVFEGMEESGSEGLDTLIASEAAQGEQGYFGGVDFCIVSVKTMQLLSQRVNRRYDWHCRVHSRTITGSIRAHHASRTVFAAWPTSR